MQIASVHWKQIGKIKNINIKIIKTLENVTLCFGAFIMAQLAFFFRDLYFYQVYIVGRISNLSPLKSVVCTIAPKTNARHVNEEREGREKL